MEGRYCRVEPVDPGRDAVDLYAAYQLDKEGRNWTYLPHGPYSRFEDYLKYLERAAASDDPFVHCVIERSSGRAVGVASYMRIDPGPGSSRSAASTMRRHCSVPPQRRRPCT